MDDGSDPEDADPSLRCWEFHDLLFHARSRRGRTDAPVGATFRFAGQGEPPPAMKPAVEPETIALDQPDAARFAGGNVSFAHVVAARRSIRRYAEAPLTVQQLAEFLFRVARVSRIQETEVDTPIGPVTMEFAPRPYPSGGGLYELEFYVAVRSCRGLAPRLYRYQADGHRLGLVRGSTPDVDQLFADAAVSSGTNPGVLQVLLILSARFTRVSWKYASIAYALILKHVGVVYQTMYLTATAMGLAPCALGAGDSDRFARTAGLDYYAETSVGEFLLGSRDDEALTPESA